jgi:hypothetical protein
MFVTLPAISNNETLNTMKKNLLIMLMALSLPCFFSACENDEDNEREVVVVNEDGTTSNGSIFLRIDDNSFYLDYVKYIVTSKGHLKVTGYSEWRAKGVANIYPRVSVKGHTYDVTYIAYNAFKNCSGLTAVTIPPTIREIGEYAFHNCSGLKFLFIPKSVNIIGEFAFSGCGGLESISVEEGNKKYDSRNNCNAIIETQRGWLLTGCKNTIIPDDTRSIFHEAFRGCRDMTSIAIPNSVTYIGQGAFEDCSGLTSITIPQSVLEIFHTAFNGCSGLSSIHCQGEIPPNSGTYGAFEKSIYSTATLFVPKGSLNAYKECQSWSPFKKIVEE